MRAQVTGHRVTNAPITIDPPTQPIVSVTRTPVAEPGVDWTAIAIGAGLAAALLFAAAGVAAVRRQHHLPVS
jgi:hypothetical protein